jgi:hypothetical protein
LIKSKCGTVAYPLGQQIADTMAVHGYIWTLNYYMQRGVTAWEFNILWLGAQGAASVATPAGLGSVDLVPEGAKVRCLLLI